MHNREKDTAGSRKISTPAKPLWRRTLGITIKAVLAAVLGLGVFAYYAYQSAQKLPDFYQETLAISDQNLAESGAVFENRVLDLQNSTRREGEWQAVFTAEQINGWMAVDLPRKFPNWLPKEMTHPRVSIEPGNLKFACQFKSNRLSGVVVATADAFCTDVENEVGIRVRSVASGIIPIPVNRLADQITTGLRKAGIPATWTEIEGDPVALISITRQISEVNDDYSVVLTGVAIKENQIVLTGKTVPR